MNSVEILHTDCEFGMKLLENDSVDSLVTDPPAGISFMGKHWDDNKGGRDQWIAWLSSVMRECMRVMKPGAHGLVWAIPRTSHWTATALEDAGFEVRDVVTHLFGSGFPKSLDVGKAIDKAAGAKREVVSTIKKTPSASKCHEGWGRPWAEGKTTMDITKPATPDAAKWQGFGTALKPASEHWILIRKPISEKTVAANVLKWGTGGLNIDASRIAGAIPQVPQPKFNTTGSIYNMKTGEGRNGELSRAEGRFPANLVLSCADTCTEDAHDMFECPIAIMDEQSGVLKNGGQNKTSPDTIGMFGNRKTQIGGTQFAGDTGGASRFFYCSKASKADKNAGLEGMPKKKMDNYASGTKRKLAAQAEDPKNPNLPRANFHPTVKSTKLMSYLIRMVTPPNGQVLDPFCGSGSTGVAALKEGFRFIGIEREAEYLKIAEARIAHANSF